MVEIRMATTRDEIEAIRRFRYSVYVEEMGRYRAVADHGAGRLAEREDERGWNFYAVEGGEVVGCVRITWGGDGFSERQVQQYGLEPFLAVMPASALALGERGMVAPSRRGGDLLLEMGRPSEALLDARDVRVVFGACEPHLLSYYLRVQMPYARRNVNSPEAGYLIPMLALREGRTAEDLGVSHLLAGTGTITSPLLSGEETYWEEVDPLLAGAGLFEGMTCVEIRRCVARSNVIACAEGDRVLKKGGAARNVFLVLSGALEVSDGGHPVAVLRPGDVFGETAFLLRGRRTFDVDVLSDGTRVLSMSERTLRNLVLDEPSAAAKLFANVSRTLAERAVRLSA